MVQAGLFSQLYIQISYMTVLIFLSISPQIFVFSTDYSINTNKQLCVATVNFLIINYGLHEY
jgi:hypothetical protein